jgi:two-component system, sensor histidine kinase and response regulator
VRELLGDEGASVTLVADGAAALQALAAGTFDAVLMDLQMPVMDGLEATRRLRAGGSDLPVVGLTANAMPADRQACLDAGMNDHVGKPFDLNQLVAVLRRVTGRAAAMSLPSSPTVAADDFTAQALEAGVRLAAAVGRFGGRRDVYLRSFEDFVGAGLDTWRETAHDAEGAVRAAHSLKGLAATLGIDGLAARAGAAEAKLGVAGSDEERAELLDGLDLDIAAVRAGLQGLLDRLSQAWRQPVPMVDAADAPDLAALRGDLDALAGLLASADMDAVERLVRVQQAHGARLGSRLTPLGRAVADLDFDAALRFCRELRDTCDA